MRSMMTCVHGMVCLGVGVSKRDAISAFVVEHPEVI